MPQYWIKQTKDVWLPHVQNYIPSQYKCLFNYCQTCGEWIEVQRIFGATDSYVKEREWRECVTMNKIDMENWPLLW